MKHFYLALLFLGLVLAGCAPTYIDFNDLSSVTPSSTTPTPVQPGDEFHVGDMLIEEDSGAKIIVLPYQWGNNTWTDGGYVSVEQGNMAGGDGYELHFNNACLGIVSPQKNVVVKKLELKFGEYGGNVNLITNGFVGNEDNFADIVPPLITLTAPQVDEKGVLTLVGNMSPYFFYYPTPPGFPVLEYTAVVGGGQELWIDDLKFK